jgi:ABC-type branched-subunit amino acid transport system substrate-binding protein
MFSTAFTLELQAERLVDYAIGAGYRRFCILAPSTGHGRELSRVFMAEVRRRGAEIISEELYAENQTDFRHQIQHLKTMDLQRYGKTSKKMIKTRKGSRTHAVHTPGFDAVFLPGEYRQAVLIASQLAFHGVRVPLLGNNTWRTPDFVRFHHSSLEGGSFINSFFAESSDPNVHDFVEEYRSVYHAEPSMTAAQSYEATQLVLKAIHQGARSGSAIREFLARSDDLPVFAGVNGFRPNGVLNRKGFLIRILSDGKLGVIQPRKVQGEVLTIKGETYVVRDGLGKEAGLQLGQNSKVQGGAQVVDTISTTRK